ncbi:MAG: PHP domain-containing protein [Solirubrobacteraceae bacterium]
MASTPRFDLQSHSTSSDGELSPAEVLAAAAKAGVELLALSDHDTVAGVSEALEAGRREGVKLVTAIEISAIDGGGSAPRELHILGYAIDHQDARLTQTLEVFLSDREQRTLRMRDALIEVGFELDEAEIEQRIAAGKPIGRPHLAGAVLRAPGNAQRLEKERIADVGDVIRAYLIEGKPAFRMRQTPTVEQAIDAIHDAGGVAVWAHPFWDIDEQQEALATVDRFAALGVDGIEAFYITHDEEQTRALYERCEQLGLLSTGSADFHGPSNSEFCRFLAFETYDLTPRLGRIAD